MSDVRPTPRRALGAAVHGGAPAVRLSPPGGLREPPLRAAARWAMVAFVFTVPWEGVVTISGVGRISKAVGLLAMALGAAAVVAHGRRTRLVDAHLGLLAFTAWVIMSRLWAVAPGEAMLRIIAIVQLALAILLLWELVRTPDHVRAAVTAFALGAGVLTLVLFLAQASGAETTSRASAGDSTHPNNVAFVLCLAMPMAWHLGITGRSPAGRTLAKLFLPAALFAIVLTASRSAVLLLGIALLIVPWSMRQAGVWTRLLVVAVVAVGVTSAPVVLPDDQVERISTTLSAVEAGSFSGREQFWATAWDGASSRPLIGWGGGGSRELIRRDVGREYGAHNTYLSILTDLGVVGLALFAFVLLAVAVGLRGAAGADRRLGVVLLGTLVLGLMPRHWEYHKVTWLVLVLVLAIARIGTSTGRVRTEVEA